MPDPAGCFGQGKRVRHYTGQVLEFRQQLMEASKRKFRSFDFVIVVVPFPPDQEGSSEMMFFLILQRQGLK